MTSLEYKQCTEDYVAFAIMFWQGDRKDPAIIIGLTIESFNSTFKS